MSQDQYAIAVGVWIKEQRAELGVTQPELAEAMGVSQASISGWENGTTSLSSWSHTKLRNFFRAMAKQKGGAA